ncbi:uncharacterized protein RSE6_04387 [Rhynchosporium secalis]|uniref:Uncharacterized protein n=1 Tax=Rhynchosporium secalis TaxID=38038 RepID=A0A1E1M563_RHYSE|nr:uncharacterized protein RSE6_04387 [Rhynchosporium secalis]
MAASSHHDDGDLETDATDHPAVPTRILKKKPSGVEIGSIRRKKAAERVVMSKSSIRSSPYSMVQDHLVDAALASDVLDIQQDPSVVEPMNDSVTSGNPYSMRAQHYHAIYYFHAKDYLERALQVCDKMENPKKAEYHRAWIGQMLEGLKGDEPAEGEACLVRPELENDELREDKNDIDDWDESMEKPIAACHIEVEDNKTLPYTLGSSINILDSASVNTSLNYNTIAKDKESTHLRKLLTSSKVHLLSLSKSETASSTISQHRPEAKKIKYGEFPGLPGAILTIPGGVSIPNSEHPKSILKITKRLKITALIQGLRRAEAFLKGPYKESFDVKALGGAMVDFNVLRQTHRKDGQLESLSAYAGKMFTRVCEENQFMERTREGLEIIPEGQELVVGDSTTSSLSGMLPIRSTSSMSGILPPPARNAESGGKFPSPPPTEKSDSTSL